MPEITLQPDFIVFLAALAGVVIGGITSLIATKLAKRAAVREGISLAWVLSGPLWLLGLAAGLDAGLSYTDLARPRLEHLDRIIFTFGLVWMAVRAAQKAVDGLFIRRPNLFPVAGLIRAAINIGILAVGVLMALDSMGIPIGPLLASLGVGSLALALALKDTLANLFGGIYLAVGQPIRPGDVVETEAGSKGTVVSVGWRSTEIRTGGNNLVVIPNDKLAQSVITNYSRPEQKSKVTLVVEIPYDQPPRKIIGVLESVLSDAQGKVGGLVADPAPQVRLIPGFQEHGIAYTLSFSVESYGEQNSVMHELRLRIYDRFQTEKIPFSVRP